VSEHRIFLSYKRDDLTTAAVERLYKHLCVVSGYDCDKLFFDQKSIDAGERWEEKIDEFMSTATLFVAFISIDFWLSKQCMGELLLAINRYERENCPHLLFVLADALAPEHLAFDRQGAMNLAGAAEAEADDAEKRVRQVKSIAQINFLGPYDDGGRLVRLETENPVRRDIQLARMVDAILRLKQAF
jgi:TIR domain